MSDAPHYQMYIDGEWLDGAENYEIRSPANGELVATVAKASTDDVDRAVAAARRSFESGVWRNTPQEERANVIATVAGRLYERIEELAVLQTKENGATIRVTGGLHLGFSIMQMQYLAEIAKTYEYETKGPDVDAPLPFSGIMRREPIGVVAAITPWNIPLLTLVWKVGPALAAGCSVVIKPDEHAPLVAMELVKEFEAAGLPKGVLNALVGDGEPVGAYLSGHPDVNKVAFTGSTEVGKAILRQSADTVKRVTLELGGKGPNIVLEDADLSVAVDGAIYAAFANNGEACEAGTRLFVQSSIADEFIKRLTERASTLTVGDPLNPASDVGPVITKEAEERILGFIEGAKKQGATAVVGGGRPQGPEFEAGNWVQPTVFTGVTNDMEIARCEVFGPVLSVLTFDSVDEVIKLANDTDYGLSAGVWSQDEEKAIEVGRQLEAGMVYINDWHVINPNYPFGGFKQSGIGREGGPHSIDEYTEAKFISVDRAGAIGNRPFALVIGTPPPGDAGQVAHELADETLAQTEQ